jgi:peptidoglycan/LPS O-acetylase OafA/YrhL
MKYRPEIDGLRAVAVLSVFLFHLGFASFSGGYVGVDIFFVISGFLITGIIQKDLASNSFSIVKFYDRRFRRIMPALYFALIPVILFTWIFFMPLEMKNFCRSLLSTLLFYSNFQFWKESGYFDLASEMKPLLHTWSLSIEEQFYIVFPTLLYLLHRFAKNQKVVVLGIFAVVSFAVSVPMANQHSDAAFYFTPVRVWELLIGALLALGAFRQLHHPKLLELLAWLGLGMLIVPVFVLSGASAFPGWNAAIPCLGAVLLIYSCQSNHTPIAGKWLGTNLMTGIGKISYSLYLWHWPMIVFAKYYLSRELQLQDQIAILLGSILIALISWRYIEQPFRERKGFFKNGKRLFYILLVSTVLLSIFAYLGGYKKVGYSRRLSKEVKQYAMAYRDTNPDRKHCHSMSIDRIEKLDLCRMGPNEKPPQFVVWGDSFADAMMPGLKNLAEQNNVPGMFASSSACAPVLGVNRRVGTLQLKCDQFNQAMLKAVDDLNIKNVLLITAWGMSGYSASDPTIQIPDAGYSAEDYSQKDINLFTFGFEKLIGELELRGIRVWVAHKIPMPKYDVPSYLGRYEMFGKNKDDLNMTLAKVNQQKQAAEGLLTTIRKDHAIEVVEPSSLLCKDVCYVQKDGLVFYHDHQHLSKIGSMFVKDVYQPFFNSMLQK